MDDALREPLKKKVGGSLRAIPPLQRLEMLRRNALMLRKGEWKPPTDDGTLVRKTVGLTR
jgi:phage portal protein BeeE